MKFKTAVSIIFLILLFSVGKSQIIEECIADSLATHHYSILEQDYNQKLEQDLAFVNGTLYWPKGNLYNNPYLDFNWAHGVVYFGNTEYEYQYMKYDIEVDGLIILKEENNASFPILLNRDIINEFSIANRHFQIIEDIPHAYYMELAYEGEDYEIFVDWKKKPYYGNSSTVQYRITQRIFVNFRSEYYEIKSISKLYKLLADKKEQLKKFQKEQNIHFYDDKLLATTALFKYYYLIGGH